MIQQLAQANPGLAQQLIANPEALYELLGVAPGEEGDEGEDEWEAGGDELMAAMGGGGAGGEGGANNVISVTEEENASIERLQSMGFERNRVLEAFLLCDRNEEMAVRVLSMSPFSPCFCAREGY
jgi:UV excision repair protein RAD23